MEHVVTFSGKAEPSDKMNTDQDAHYSHSLSFYAWQRLKKNKLALFGLFLICLFIVIALLGYSITADSTPDANDQKLELAIKPPGFRAKELRIRKNEPTHKRNFFSKMIFGEENDYKEAPFYGIELERNDIIYEEYTGNEENNGAKIKYNMADVIYAIDFNKPFVDYVDPENANNGYVEFYDMDSQKQLRKKTSELKEEIISKHINSDHKFLLGTDRAGRDMLSRLIIGTRVSLAVGIIAVILSIFIGTLLGSISGYFRGWVDDVIMWIINVVWSIPTLLLAIAITLALGKGFWQVFIAVGLTMWVGVARLVRGQVMSLREKEFVEAGRALGFSSFRIITRHVLPNIVGQLIVLSAENFSNAILIEAGLSFLGIGAQPPTASWGAMISAHRGYIIADAAYLAFLPGFAIMVMVLAFVLLTNGLRDAFDAKTIEEVSV